MEKKIRVTINKSVADMLASDAKNFNISKNYLLNYIFTNLKKSKSDENYKIENNKVAISFNLNKKNLVNYYNFLAQNNIQVEAPFIRQLIYKYASWGVARRELFVYKKIVNLLNIAIENKSVVKIEFRDGRKTEVHPYYVGSSRVANYLFCYDMESKKYKNYKLMYIKSIFITKFTRAWQDEDFIKSVIGNFDPFLMNEIVKVKLTSNGVKLYNAIVLNKPKLIEIDEDVYTFECSQEKAKRYFSYFLDDVEIIAPDSLREWFIEKYISAIKKYQLDFFNYI